MLSKRGKSIQTTRLCYEHKDEEKERIMFILVCTLYEERLSGTYSKIFKKDSKTRKDYLVKMFGLKLAYL